MHLIQIGCTKWVAICAKNRIWQNVVDKGRERWYTHKAFEKEGGCAGRSVQKKLEKSFKKVLTKAGRGDIMYRLSQGSEAPWKLNNKTTLFLEKEVDKTPKNSFEFIWTLIISKEPKTALRDVIRGNPVNIQFFREFDPGSGWTLAACITHSSRTVTRTSVLWSVADGWVTREQPALYCGITTGNSC